MTDVQQAVRQLTVSVTDDGVTETSKKVQDLANSEQSLDAAQQRRISTAQRQQQVLAGIIAQQTMMNAQLVQQAAMYNQASTANDNFTESSRISAAEVLNIVNRLREATTAAYVVSPAFRGVVNALALPALTAARAGIAGATTALVAGTNAAGTGLITLAGAAERASPNFLALGSSVRSTGLAMEAFAPSASGVAAGALGIAGAAATRLIPLIGPLMLLADAISLVGKAWDLGGQAIEQYVQIAAKASAVDMSTSYFQKLMKGAEDSKIPVDQLTASLENLQKASAATLGGSALQNRLDASVKAGNFAGNPGIGMLTQANTTEQKFGAIVTLIHQAMQDGQRLAALDIASTAFGPQLTDALRRDSGYLDNLATSAAAVSNTQIVSDADIGRAQEMKDRWTRPSKFWSNAGIRCKISSCGAAFVSTRSGPTSSTRSPRRWTTSSSS